jgi:hypothetical protein
MLNEALGSIPGSAQSPEISSQLTPETGFADDTAPPAPLALLLLDAPPRGEFVELESALVPPLAAVSLLRALVPPLGPDPKLLDHLSHACRGWSV